VVVIIRGNNFVFFFRLPVGTIILLAIFNFANTWSTKLLIPLCHRFNKNMTWCGYMVQWNPVSICTNILPLFSFFIIVDFLSYIWQFILFKILFQLYKIISCVWTLFSDTTNHNKIYNIFKFFNKVKHNLKSQWRQ
jgi:hypothetical protein